MEKRLPIIWKLIFAGIVISYIYMVSARILDKKELSKALILAKKGNQSLILQNIKLKLELQQAHKQLKKYECREEV